MKTIIYSLYRLKDCDTQEYFWLHEKSPKDAAKKARLIKNNDHTYQVMISNKYYGYDVLGTF